MPLTWMVREAIKAGLTFDYEKVQEMGCLNALSDAGEDGCDNPTDAAAAQPAGLDVANVPDIMIRSPSGMGPELHGPVANASNSDSTPDAKTGQTDAQDHSLPQHLVSFHDMMHKAHLALIHDSLSWDCGMSIMSILSWRFMEYLLSGAWICSRTDRGSRSGGHCHAARCGTCRTMCGCTAASSDG